MTELFKGHLLSHNFAVTTSAFSILAVTPTAQCFQVPQLRLTHASLQNQHVSWWNELRHTKACQAAVKEALDGLI